MRLVVTNHNKCNKGYYYLVRVTNNIYYSIVQHGQRTWVAHCLNSQINDGQFYTGNSYDIVTKMKSLGSDVEFFYATNTPEFRKGMMAVLVGIRPTSVVTATTGEYTVNIEVSK